MKKVILFSLFVIFILGKSQNVNCLNAVQQLQNYATQVNTIYNQEYFENIPKIRCPAFNQFGQYYNPQMVNNCRTNFLVSLNQWYGQQSINVNNWYFQIVQSCNSNSQTPGSLGPANKPTKDSGGNINTNQIKDLVVGVDQGKALRIDIPTTAQGYNPN